MYFRVLPFTHKLSHVSKETFHYLLLAVSHHHSESSFLTVPSSLVPICCHRGYDLNNSYLTAIPQDRWTFWSSLSSVQAAHFIVCNLLLPSFSPKPRQIHNWPHLTSSYFTSAVKLLALRLHTNIPLSKLKFLKNNTQLNWNKPGCLLNVKCSCFKKSLHAWCLQALTGNDEVCKDWKNIVQSQFTPTL